MHVREIYQCKHDFTIPNSSSMVEPLFCELETPKTLLNNIEKALPQTPKIKQKHRII